MGGIEPREIEEDHTPVTNIHEFRDKYGTKGAGLIVSAFVAAAPRFQNDVKLARLLGQMTDDLESALTQL